eukprot:scaffold1499_cov255-Pinguiococcus_pyrenoidosus.AAC.28
MHDAVDVRTQKSVALFAVPRASRAGDAVGRQAVLSGRAQGLPKTRLPGLLPIALTAGLRNASRHCVGQDSPKVRKENQAIGFWRLRPELWLFPQHLDGPDATIVLRQRQRGCEPLESVRRKRRVRRQEQSKSPRGRREEGLRQQLQLRRLQNPPAAELGPGRRQKKHQRDSGTGRHRGVPNLRHDASKRSVASVREHRYLQGDAARPADREGGGVAVCHAAAGAGEAKEHVDVDREEAGGDVAERAEDFSRRFASHPRRSHEPLRRRYRIQSRNGVRSPDRRFPSGTEDQTFPKHGIKRTALGGGGGLPAGVSGANGTHHRTTRNRRAAVPLLAMTYFVYFEMY